MTIHDIYRPILRRFRAGRMRRFYRDMAVTPESRILDIGGTPFNWLLAVEIGMPAPRSVTLLNLDAYSEALPRWMNSVKGDARDLGGTLNSFDIAFSNSVIEHLETWDNQLRMAHEIARVATRFWIQTPDPRFPVEPHYLAPFVHWIPLRWRGTAALLTPWYLLERPSRVEITRRIAEIRLMNASEMQIAFPGAEILTERLLGWPKALLAVKR
jgi:hypothetical protein